MIRVLSPINFDVSSSFSLSVSEQRILDALVSSPQLYTYSNEQQLRFEIALRNRIVRAAGELAKSRARFAIFRFSRCNSEFWTRDERGGFRLRPDVTASEAIQDIFIHSERYAFECATAIVIVFYKAALDVIDTSTFNRLFADLLLYDWHTDRDLGIRTKKGEPFLPGDCLYFKNPEFDPQTPQWQGENTIYLGDGLFYGHGIGIQTADGIIAALNRRRKQEATKSAYLLPDITQVDFAYLSQFARRLDEFRLPIRRSSLIVGTLGSALFLHR
ncbi:protein-glutamine gamma-glutamyltransferase [Geobacillus thermocatenulatus]|uniref:Protein-glutamine gamma-glutamyltransferase n=1 Tax=Geobacillus thermocatenulatus TaxID=33938 RepID=A0A226Q9M8_9BACL|nr:protein-glutamine gamma-glutamyltransferase [Geobacillus thermocatenulatus]KLR74230.1 transglutaminase [Geobacillus sp. T6]KPC98062.1 Protein-glutamine gamma-glutamyltransferase [Geobacillus sp. BCO2]OXB89183.1 protein-glutamine gamma-glutamyltransferase [Geobacillus thermocatenulatus]RAN22398.1 transglutaminase [Geobacillus sp. A8]